MKAQEEKGKRILRLELGDFYAGQSFEELQPLSFCGFYLMTCHERKIELNSEIIMELQITQSIIVIEKVRKNLILVFLMMLLNHAITQDLQVCTFLMLKN